jgi:hypothetical protein
MRPHPIICLLSCGLTLLVVLSNPRVARSDPGQAVFYTFTSGPGGDGFVWDFDSPPSGDHDLPDRESFFAPDGSGQEGHEIEFENSTGDTTFFDANYVAVGNSSHISQDAWWGHPLDNFEVVGLSFFNTPPGTIDSFGFEFAWALAGQHASTSLEVIFEDPDGDTAVRSFDLDDIFDAGVAFGGFNGAAGKVQVAASELIDGLGNPLDGIESLIMKISPVVTDDGSGEFAIDNVSINGGGQATFSADFNRDGAVDGTDLPEWLGSFALDDGADADDDGDSDGNDLLAWQQQYGSGSVATLKFAAVPEPSALILGALASILVGSRLLRPGRWLR